MAVENLEIDTTTTLRVRDWGLGMFEKNDMRCEVVGPGEIWFMAGNKEIDLSRAVGHENGSLQPDEARCIGTLLIAAADAAEAAREGVE